MLEVTPIIHVQHFQNMFTCLVTGAVGSSMQEVGICYWMIYMQGGMCTRYGKLHLLQFFLIIVSVFVNTDIRKGNALKNKFGAFVPCRLKDAGLRSVSE